MPRFTLGAVMAAAIVTCAACTTERPSPLASAGVISSPPQAGRYTAHTSTVKRSARNVRTAARTPARSEGKLCARMGCRGYALIGVGF